MSSRKSPSPLSQNADNFIEKLIYFNFLKFEDNFYEFDLLCCKKTNVLIFCYTQTRFYIILFYQFRAKSTNAVVVVFFSHRKLKRFDAERS
jgi:hypothetical protein